MLRIFPGCQIAAVPVADGGEGTVECFLQALPGAQAVLDLVEFDRQLEGADPVVTGESRIDGQSVHGKVISGIARQTRPRNIPLVAIVGDIADGAEEAYDLGVTAVFGTDQQAAAFEQVAPRTRENYQRTLEDILRLIRAVEAKQI